MPDGPQVTPDALGTNVAGFLRGGLGLGEAGRLYVNALERGGVPVRTLSIDPRLPRAGLEAGPRPVARTTEFEDLETHVQTPFNLVCVNAPELPRFYGDVGTRFFDGRHTIGVWAWEVDKVPEDWAYSFELVDEIWVYSRYVEEILAPHSPVPVVRMPLPVLSRQPSPAVAPDLGVGPGFTFLFLFDFYSTLQRKNPLGLIEAFSRAFKPGEGPQLLLKSFNGDYKADRLAAVQKAAAGRPDIHVVDRFVSGAEKDALMDACDCYVSLHRAEGFGLTMAEAMALGKPVIATGYSGNLDFMSEENSYLARYALTEVGPDGENYPSEGHWAEPDLDHAAALMREVWEDSDGARARAERGRADVARDFSLEAVGGMARGRLEEISRTGSVGRRPDRGRRPPPPPAGSLPLARAELGLKRDAMSYAQGVGGAKGLWRKLVLRAIRPYTAHQETFNSLMVESLGEVVDRLERVHTGLLELENDRADAGGKQDTPAEGGAPGTTS